MRHLFRTLLGAAADAGPRYGALRAGDVGPHLGYRRGRPGRPAARGDRDRDRDAHQLRAHGHHRRGGQLRVRQPAARHLHRHGRARRASRRRSRPGYVLVADGRLTADFALEVGGLNETVEVTVESETVNTTSGEVARTVDRAAGAGPGAERPQLPAAHDPDPRRARPQPERARHHDRPRHQHRRSTAAAPTRRC